MAVIVQGITSGGGVDAKIATILNDDGTQSLIISDKDSVIDLTPLDSEINEQTDLIAQIQAELDKIAEGDGNSSTPTVSLTPTDGVVYDSGISGFDVEMLNALAGAISNNKTITDRTSSIYFDYKDTHRGISVGDKLIVDIGGTYYDVNIIGFNHDELNNYTAYGTTATGKAGISFQMLNCYGTAYPMNSSSTNANGWTASAMRNTHLPAILALMPTDLQGVIKEVVKSTQSGGMTGALATTYDNLFLLSEVEVMGSNAHSLAGEGRQYNYYEAGNSKVKDSHWFTRSPYTSTGDHFVYITPAGAADLTGASASIGVAFAFCI